MVPNFRLEETTQNLQQTKEKLNQEEFICSELTSAQEHLYATAGQVPTADVGASFGATSGVLVFT